MDTDVAITKEDAGCSLKGDGIAEGRDTATKHDFVIGQSECGPSTIPNESSDGLHYGVADVPPVPMLILFSLQMAVTNTIKCLGYAVLISNLICADKEFTMSLHTATVVVSGTSTILQTLIGLRLPVFQGPSSVFLVPYLAAKSDPSWGCNSAWRNVTITGSNVTELEAPWMTNWQKTQGSLMMASILHLVVGFFGLGGLLLRIVGPLTITTMITLLGLTLWPIISVMAEPSWMVATFSMAVAVVCCRYIHAVRLPIPMWRSAKGWTFTWYPLFQLFPVLLSVSLTWLLCYILTVSGAFTDDKTDRGYDARTDVSLHLINNATAFNFSYQGNFRKLEIDGKFLLVFLVCSLSSILESLGDYIQTGYACRTSLPPTHALNRGILMEGIGVLMSGVFSSGHATTSFSGVIGIINATKVASRSVMVLAAVLTVVMATLGHVTAVLVNIPKPALAGTKFLGISLMMASALSNLRMVDLSKQRNVTVLGCSLLAGTMIPGWLKKNPTAIQTGEPMIDMIFHTLLSIPLIVGGVLSGFLDATLPGPRSRYNIADMTESNNTTRMEVFETRWMRYIVEKFPILGYLPILPRRREENAELSSKTDISHNKVDVMRNTKL